MFHKVVGNGAYGHCFPREELFRDALDALNAVYLESGLVQHLPNVSLGLLGHISMFISISISISISIQQQA